jgi:hypothetical protein
VGNKLDLRVSGDYPPSRVPITREQGEALAKRIGAVKCMTRESERERERGERRWKIYGEI